MAWTLHGRRVSSAPSRTHQDKCNQGSSHHRLRRPGQPWQHARRQAPRPLSAQDARNSNDQQPDSNSSPSSSSAPSSSVPDSLPVFDSQMDWREFRARMVAQSRKAAVPSSEWAHSVAQPETGCLLLAHPLLFTDSQQYFRFAVILILQHDDVHGSWGVILNRPSVYRVRQVEALTNLQPEFSDCRLYLGGDCGDTQLHMVHNYGHLEGSMPVVQGVYMGGFPAARKAISESQLDPQNIKVFINYAGWGPKQLENECSKGVWFVAAASPSIILSQLEGGEDCTTDMWHKVAQLMGGDHALLSQRVREAEEKVKAAEKRRSAASEDS